MRLINTSTLALEEFIGDQIPSYAILSHAWRDGEVSYSEWQDRTRRSTMRGFHKISSACIIAQRHSLDYIWVDTNCINKDSSAELSEAINSMYLWYQRSSTCFVYLDDFEYNHSSDGNLEACRWFGRGWTLQELLAPTSVRFFNASWVEFGTRQSLIAKISRATGIQPQYLLRPESIRAATVARRMSWMASRSTTREEDMAYCLLGLFEINMPLLYGEGKKAFIRLQEEIIRHSNEHTIFCWSWPPSGEPIEPLGWQGCFAPSPRAFRDSGGYIRAPRLAKSIPSDFQLTNSGLRITLPLLQNGLGPSELVVLNAKDPRTTDTHLCLCVRPVTGEEDGTTFARAKLDQQLVGIRLSRPWTEGGTSIYLAHERDPDRKVSTILTSATRRVAPPT